MNKVFCKIFRIFLEHGSLLLGKYLWLRTNISANDRCLQVSEKNRFFESNLVKCLSVFETMQLYKLFTNFHIFFIW